MGFIDEKEEEIFRPNYICPHNSRLRANNYYQILTSPTFASPTASSTPDL